VVEVAVSLHWDFGDGEVYEVDYLFSSTESEIHNTHLIL
jgi:hypothetical protein